MKTLKLYLCKNCSTKRPSRLRFFGRLVFACALATGLLAAHDASAQVGGSVIVASNAWMGGFGVDVHWNASEPCGYWGDSYTICPSSGQSVYTGCEWQCVELPQRLYTTRGWHCGAWSVSKAYQLFNNPSVGTSYNNGSGYVPVSGDLAVWKSSLPGSGGAGHVAVVDYVDAYNVYICEENWSSTGRATLTRSGSNGSFLSRSGVSDKNFYGIVHNPNNTFGNLAPAPRLWSWASQPVNTNADGRMEVWAVGTDGNVYHNVQTAANGSWNGWVSTGLPGALSGVTLAQNSDGRLEAFARGANNSVWHNPQTTANGSWSGWSDLASPAAQGTPVVGLDLDGRLEVCVRDTSGAIWDNFQTAPGGSYYGWVSLGGTIASDLAVSREADARVGLFANGTDGNVYYNHQGSPNGSWNGWVSIGAPSGGAKSTPAVAQNADGRLEVYTLDGNKSVWRNYQTVANGGWNGWVSIGGAVISPIKTGHNLDGRIELFVVGTDSNVYHNYQSPNPGSPFVGWANLASGGTGVKSGDSAAVGNYADGRLALIMVSGDNTSWNNYQYPVNATSWSGWTGLGGTISYLFK